MSKFNCGDFGMVLEYHTKCPITEQTLKLYEKMPRRYVISLNAMIARNDYTISQKWWVCKIGNWDSRLWSISSNVAEKFYYLHT